MENKKIIKSFPDLLAFIDDILRENNFSDSELWFRGEPPNVKTPVTPSVWRYEEKDLLYKYESNLISKFYSKAPLRYSNCPRQDEYVKWLFLMQHYGLPTRLLDWTESIFVAIYFAIKYAKKYDDYEKTVIWALKPHRLNEKFLGQEGVFIGSEDNFLIKNMFPSPKNNSNDNVQIPKVAAILPIEVDMRIFVQQSVFTIHTTPESLAKICDKEILKKIEWNYPVDAKDYILNYLRNLGISEQKLFPDLEHLAKDIVEETKYAFEYEKKQRLK